MTYFHQTIHNLSSVSPNLIIFVVYGFLETCRTLWYQRKPKLIRAYTFQVKICPNHYSGSSLNSKNDFGEFPIGLALYYCPLSRDIRIQNLTENNFCLSNLISVFVYFRNMV